MSDNKTNVTVSLPLFGVIGLILVIMKLGGVMPVAAWSWWLVTLPFWIGLAIFGVVVLIALVIFLLAAIFGPRRKW